MTNNAKRAAFAVNDLTTQNCSNRDYAACGASCAASEGANDLVSDPASKTLFGTADRPYSDQRHDLVELPNQHALDCLSRALLTDSLHASLDVAGRGSDAEPLLPDNGYQHAYRLFYSHRIEC